MQKGQTETWFKTVSVHNCWDYYLTSKATVWDQVFMLHSWTRKPPIWNLTR